MDNDCAARSGDQEKCRASHCRDVLGAMRLRQSRRELPKQAGVDCWTLNEHIAAIGRSADNADDLHAASLSRSRRN